MEKAVPWMKLAGILIILVAVSVKNPSYLGDQNKFLSDFVGEELLSILGFMVAVTVASSSSIHFELNRIEDATGKNFSRTRSSLGKSIYSLIILFGFALLIVIVKPLLPAEPRNISLANSLAIAIIYFNLSVMLDLARAVIKIPSIKSIKHKDSEGSV